MHHEHSFWRVQVGIRNSTPRFGGFKLDSTPRFGGCKFDTPFWRQVYSHHVYSHYSVDIILFLCDDYDDVFIVKAVGLFGIIKECSLLEKYAYCIAFR